MECLNTLWGLCFRHNISEPQAAAVFKAASESPVFSCENIIHHGAAVIGGYSLRSDAAVHSKTGHDVHAKAVDIEHDVKNRPMLIATNNDPVAMDAVGLPVIWRDSP